MAGRVLRVDAAGKEVVEPSECPRRAVDDGDIGAQPGRHHCRVGADGAAADNHHRRRLDAGDAAEQLAAAAVDLFQMVRAGLHRQSPGHLGHRRQQRQAAIGRGDGFIGDAGGAGGDQVARQLGIGREVEIGEEQLSRPQQRPLRRLGLLHLDDQLGGGEHRLGRGGGLGADGAIGLVIGADAGAGVVLDNDAVTVVDELVDALGSEPDAVFVVLRFPGNADDHLRHS